jgi:hypothetical protein
MTLEERFTLRDRWVAFLKKHRKELANGKRFPITDPELQPLVHRPGSEDIVFNLSFKDGSQWPALKKSK